MTRRRVGGMAATILLFSFGFFGFPAQAQQPQGGVARSPDPALRAQTEQRAPLDRMAQADGTSGGSAQTEGWTFVVTPYAWFVSVGGNVTVRDRSVPADVSFSNIFDKLNIGFMGQFEARNGPFGVFVNPVYAQLTSENAVGRTQVETTADMLLVDFGAFYRVGQWTLGEAPAGETPRVALEPYLGGRLFSVDTEITFTGLRGVDRTADKGQSWADPILGVRTIWDLDNNWSVLVQADVGGFGASSDITWQAIGLLGYRFGLFRERDAYALAGYRALHDNYTDGNLTGKSGWDVTLQGPVLGLGIEF